MRYLGKAVTGCVLVGAVFGIVACGSSSSTAAAAPACAASSGSSSSGKTVDIYSSLPLQGASTRPDDPMVNGIKLALRRPATRPDSGRSSTRRSTTPRPRPASGTRPDRRQRPQGGVGLEGRLLHRRVQLGRERGLDPDPQRGRLPQVSPANTYVGLTTNEPGSAPGEPQKYYPTGKRTYLRIVPHRLDPGRIGPDGDEAGRAARRSPSPTTRRPTAPGWPRCSSSRRATTASTIVSNTGIDPTAPNFRSYAATVKGQGADCFFFAGIVSNGGVADHQGRPRGAPDGEDLRRRRRVHRARTRARRRAASPRASTR